MKPKTVKSDPLYGQHLLLPISVRRAIQTYAVVNGLSLSRTVSTLLTESLQAKGWMPRASEGERG